MGVVHFMGLGKAVGAVTCAVDYIEKALDLLHKRDSAVGIKQLFSKSGGITHNEMDRGKIESIVLFTSQEVICRKITAYAYEGKPSPGPVRDEVLKVLDKVWRRADPDKGRMIYWCEVDIDNFKDCFDKAIKIFYRFSAPGKQGKEIWCNLTGGTNAIGLALLSASRLTGLSTKNYLIGQRKEFQNKVTVPISIKINPNYDEYFNLLPFLKTHIDTVNFYNVLFELQNFKEPITSEKILFKLKNKNIKDFLNMKLDVFKREYLLKLYGLGYIDYDLEKDTNFITEEGKTFIGELQNLEYVLELEDKLLLKEIDIIEASKSWSWFKEKDKL